MNLLTQKLISPIRTKKLTIVLGLCALAFYMQAAMLNGHRRDLQVDGKDAALPRPVMFTFYEPVEGGCCGMTQAGDQKLLGAWEQGWHDKGWDTRILTEEDARKHPTFWVLEKKLAALDINPYNRRCFWRWLAMASEDIGGGWMSDYDVIPLSFTAEKGQEISKDDSFKTYGLFVPCLLHASREEWDRLIHLMTDALPEKNHGDISDMNSFKAISYWVSGIKGYDHVLRRLPYTKNDEGEAVINCVQTQGFHYKAVHLSHFGITESFKMGHYPKLTDSDVKVDNISKALELRGDVAIQLMEDIHEQCDPNDSVAATKK